MSETATKSDVITLNGKLRRTIIGAVIIGALSWATLQLLAVRQVKSKAKQNKQRIQRLQSDVSEIKHHQRDEVLPTLKRIETQTSDED